jgi:hypothetical protein
MSSRKPLRPTATSSGGNMKGKKEDQYNSAEIDEIASDARFKDALSAPMFKSKVHAKDNKIVLDDRFKSVLTDERFRVIPGASVDQYGRKKKKKANEARALDELKDFYTVEQGEEDHEKEDEEGFEETKAATKSKGGKSGKLTGKTDEEQLDYLTRLARGEISGSDDDSDEDSDDDDDEGEVDEDSEEEDEEEDHELLRNKKSPLDVDDVDDDAEYGEATYRISILNCDWENIRAQDLM